MDEIIVVELDKKERALHDSICWDLDELSKKEYGDRIEQLDKMGQLAEFLFKRHAIPKVRLAYFTDPTMNVGGHGKSRREVFEKNGTSGRDIYRHPHFMAYLRYFIYGPDLPKDTIRGFYKIIDEDRGTSGMVVNQISAYVRKEVREKRLPSDPADEFFKLAHEVKRPDLAVVVRSAAKQVRIRK